MATSGEGERVTALLRDPARLAAGAPADELLTLVYTQLRRIAQQRMADERAGHTLQATALVHEAYVRLIGDREVEWAGRAHFFHAAAEAMRRILVEHARARGRVKRGGGAQRIPLNVLDLAADADAQEIGALDAAIKRLEAQDPSAGAVVRLRFYAGLTVEQTAASLGLSGRTVIREWNYARAVLFRELEGQYAAPAGDGTPAPGSGRDE